MKDERVLLKSYLKTLKLPTITREYQAIARASANNPFTKSTTASNMSCLKAFSTSFTKASIRSSILKSLYSNFGGN